MNNLQHVDLHLSDLSAKVPRECGVRQNAPNWVQSRGKVVAIFWFCFHTVGRSSSRGRSVAVPLGFAMFFWVV